jgi:hypothetical protein
MTEPKNTGQFAAGNPGKPKGAKNKNTQLIRDMIVQALDNSGGVDYLQRQADAHPTAFLSLIGKVMPVQVEGTDTPIKHSVKVTFG